MYRLLLVLLFVSTPSHAQTVKTQPLNEVVYFPEYPFSSEVVANDQTTISSQIMGALQTFHVKPGQVLEAGQLIAEIDCSDIQDQLEINLAQHQEIKANLTLAELQLQRLNTLEKKSLASVSSIDQASAQKQALKAQFQRSHHQISLSKRDVERCKIRSPYMAVVSEKLAGTGQWLSVGSPVVALSQLDQAEVEVKMPLNLLAKQDLNQAKWGQKMLRFLRKSQRVSSQSKQVSIWYQAPKSLLIGEQGTVYVRARQAHLPANLLNQRDNKVGFFVVSEQTAKFVAIEGAQIGRPAPVADKWLQKNVVVEGQLALQDGDTVEGTK